MARCKLLSMVLCAGMWLNVVAAEPPGTDGPWPAEKAWRWYFEQPWQVGCNFLPSTAVNDVEMWQKETFDPTTLERELGWAQELGFNTVRVFINYVVWETDAAGLKQRVNRFLEIADRHGIRAVLILFDDCFKPEPEAGRQPDPEPGVHNSQWVQSPGTRRRGDKLQWPSLERYVKDMVGAFGQDRRVVMWDLYNEPSLSRELVAATFQWARAARPSQPLTSCWLGVEHSDILSFHCYGDLNALREEMSKLQPNRRGRPCLCTEWMARPNGSRFETHLPYFKEQRIGCWNWGFVSGRTQTIFPWGAPKGGPEPKLWFHDVLRRDGAPFDAREVRLIKQVNGVLQPAAWQALVATAEKAPVPWHYTLEKPPEHWFGSDFDATSWRQGAAPFGTEDSSVPRKPNTVWSSPDIWLRREFEMPPGNYDALAVRMQHDDNAEVYINGVLAAEVSGYNATYEVFELTGEGQKAVKPGRNVLAVHCHQTIGGQYIDAGLVGTPARTGQR